MSIDVLVCRIVALVVPHKQISHILDRVAPRQPQLIVSFVELGLQGPFEVQLEVVILVEGRAVADLSAEGACTVSIDVLLDRAEERSFFLRLYIDARDVIRVGDTFYSFFDDELILLVLELYDLKLPFILGGDDSFEVGLFFIEG